MDRELAEITGTPEPDAHAEWDLYAAFEHLRKLSREDVPPDLASRQAWLDALLQALDRHEADLIDAVRADFGWRAPQETRLAELQLVRQGLRHTLKHLRQWMAPERVRLALTHRPASASIVRQPLGVVGIIAPWNYPIQLSLLPLVAAIAAGNRVMLKPPELCPRTTACLTEVLKAAIPSEIVSVHAGDAEVASAFSALPFDHLFFTGSTRVGKLVAAKAARNLTPLTLELGGKSPAVVSTGADLEAAADAIVAGKLLNAGQTCVAPDYVLLVAKDARPFAGLVEAAVKKMYPDALANADFTSIISAAHVTRLRAMVDEARREGAEVIEIGGGGNPLSGARFAPTLVIGPNPGLTLMDEEIFGPVLPIVLVPTDQDAIDFIVRRDRPLAMYWFGDLGQDWQQALQRCVVGGITVGDCLMHMTAESLPFGGVGSSGMGAYHGEQGFLTFTKRTPVFRQSPLAGARFLRPPYGRAFEMTMRLLRRLG